MGARKILLLNGPNLNLLGTREPAIYGSATLADHVAAVESACARIGWTMQHHQSNVEGELVDVIHSARSTADGIIINPGAYTHTSVAIRDAVPSVSIPTVECHLSNIHKREEFRHRSLVVGVAAGQVMGFGADSYLLGLRALAELLDRP